MPQQLDAVAFLADLADRGITYLPRLNPYAGSREAGIMLLRVVHWWKFVGRRPFYKFFAPCQHQDYRPGDSWVEELGFSRDEIEGALSKIGTKLRPQMSKEEILASRLRRSLVIFWTDKNRQTFFEINENLLLDFTLWVYSCSGNPEQLSIREKSDLVEIPIQENSESLSNRENSESLSFTNTDALLETNTDPARAPRDAGNGKKPPAPPAPKDPHKFHPNTQLVKGLVGHLPAKTYWRRLAECPPINEQKASDILLLYQSVGGFHNNIAEWFFGWYAGGVPSHYRGRPVEGKVADLYRRKEGAANGRSKPAGEQFKPDQWGAGESVE